MKIELSLKHFQRVVKQQKCSERTFEKEMGGCCPSQRLVRTLIELTAGGRAMIQFNWLIQSDTLGVNEFRFLLNKTHFKFRVIKNCLDY